MTPPDPAIIDMHCHWVPEALAEALRARAAPPRIEARDGGEILLAYREGLPFRTAMTDVAARLAFMDRTGVACQVLSMPGLFGVDSLPADQAAPLVRLFNDGLAALVAEHPGRFAGIAALPLADPDASVAELRRAIGEHGFVGAILPADGFATRKTAEAYEPVIEAGNALGAHLFVHPGPVPDPAAGGPGLPPDVDNANQRHITLGVQARLSEVVMTLAMTDLMAPFSNVTVQVANLGGNMPFMIDRLDEVSRSRTPDEPLPSTRLRNVYVDTSTFGPRSVALAAQVFGADRVLVGTDHPIFSSERMFAAIAGAPLSEADRALIRSGNAARILAGTGK